MGVTAHSNTTRGLAGGAGPVSPLHGLKRTLWHLGGKKGKQGAQAGMGDVPWLPVAWEMERGEELQVWRQNLLGVVKNSM